MSAPKLTKPQREALAEICQKPRPFADHWKPVKRLVELGYAVKKFGTFSNVYHATDAGRQALAKASA